VLKGFNGLTCSRAIDAIGSSHIVAKMTELLLRLL
jgi:hypothetical protein